ncbi:MAG: hypothetical protein H6730_36435 [Deltaproteobacteria bacterium]|nr:hypothetical protein [Deltaproteobacteria bacterium]
MSTLLAAGLPGLAYAQDARPVRADAPRSEPARGPAGLPPELAQLPRSAEAALYAPHLVDALTDLHDLTEILKTVDPALGQRSAPELLAQVLFGNGWTPGAPGPARPVLARLATPEGLRAVGVDPQGPVTALLSPESGVAVVGFELVSRPAFERWLDALGGDDRTRLELGGEHASVLGAASDVPVTCIARHNRAFCQLGAATGKDPVAALREVATGPKARLGDVAGLTRAHAALPSGARLLGVLNTEAMAGWLTREAAAYGARANRFASAAERNRAVAEARAMGEKVRHVAKKVEGTAFGVYRDDESLSLRTEVALSDFGARLLAPHLRAPGEHPLVTGWALTPALARLVLRIDPRSVAKLGEKLGLALPQDSLTGDLALISLGVDSECPMARAKKAQAAAHLRWPFLMPSAVAIGVVGPEAATALHEALSKQLDVEPGEVAPGSRAHLEGRVGGSPYEIEVRDDVMLAGTGLGSAPAAVRRLSAVKAQPPREDAPLLEAAVDLLAVDAAFAAGSFGRDHTPELLTMEALRLTLKPLWDHVAQVEWTVRAEDSARRLSSQVVLRPPP